MLDGKASETPDPRLPLARAIRALLDRRADLKPDLRAANPRVPHALESIVGRCLAADPADRYPDAAALADDLQRFLDRRPLSHAENPSRRERAGNWARRNARRLTLAAVAMAAVGFTAAWALSPRPAAVVAAPVRAPAPKPAPETNPVLLRAVEAFDKGHEPDLKGLRDLAEEHPESPLVNFYLCAALEAQGQGSEADGLLPQVWARPESAHAELTAWGRSHPKLTELAVRLGGGVLDRTDDWRDKRSPRLATAARALELARSLRPDHLDLRRRLAKLAEMRGDYAAALAAWTGLIESASAPGWDPGAIPESLDVLLWTRSRVATEWGQSLLDDSATGADAVARAVGLFHKAIDDQGAASGLLAADDAKKRVPIVWVGCETRLALGRGLERQGDRVGANESFREAGKLLETLRPLVGEYIPGARERFDELANRVGEQLGAPRDKPTADPGGSPNSGE
jgi:hypothetical protein